MAVRALIVGGLLALIAGVAVAGAQTGHRQLASNLVPGDTFVIVLRGGDRMCQDGERVPAGTSALRMTIGTYGRPGPPLDLRVAGREARLGGGWREGTVLIPVPRADRAEDGDVCLRNGGSGRIVLSGGPVDVSEGARLRTGRTGARARIEYTTTEERSWWALLGTITDRIGNVRVGFPGAATGWLWIVLLGLVVAGVGTVLLFRLPRAGYVVTVLALVNAIAWGLVIPPFQVPDETAHFYYASWVAKTGEAAKPHPLAYWYSDKLNGVLGTMDFLRVVGRPSNRPPWTDADRARTVAEERSDLDATGVGDAASATSNSPVYYLLQAAAYDASPSSDITDRLAVMRLLSAILSALTVACIFAFLRELLPGSPWSATVGALAAAMQPMFGFISSGVNNDGALYLCSALVLFGLARAFRRGLTPRRAALIGGALAVGTLVKTQLIAFAPAVALAFLLMLRPPRPPWLRIAWRPLAAGALAVAAPLLVYFVLGQTVWDRPLLDRVDAVVANAGPQGEPQVTGAVSYVWQSYLPRLPFLQDWFGGYALKTLWVDGLIGRFGWLDYSFPRWVMTLGTLALVLVAAGAVATLARRWEAVRRRAGEAVVYAAVAVGFAVVVALASYLSRLSTGQLFEQARYLLPLLPLYAAAIALAIHALGQRWARLLGSAIVLAGLAHTVFAQLLTMTRYYG